MVWGRGKMRYNPEKLLDLCRILLPKDSTLEAEVRFSMEAPMQYLLHTNQQELLGTNKLAPRPISNLPWFALIHALKRRRLIMNWNDQTVDSKALYKSLYKPMECQRLTWVIKEGRWNTSYATAVNESDQECKAIFFQLAKHYLILSD
jgi:hypothetical protein